MSGTWPPESLGKDSGTEGLIIQWAAVSSSQQQPAPEALVQSFPVPFALHRVFSF